jgi:hypothetical protein
MATLQQQGVPIPSKLNGPANVQRPASTARSPQAQPRPKGTGTRTSNGPRNSSSGRPIRDYSPVAATSKASGSVGLIEGEFFGGILLLVLLMFTNTTSSYGDRIMNFMKRGFLMCITFIILSLVASIGPNASKIAKAMGGLIIVAILVTSPVDDGITLFDSFIKAEWKGTDETGNDYTSDPNGSTPSNSSIWSSISGFAGDVFGVMKNLGGIT